MTEIQKQIQEGDYIQKQLNSRSNFYQQKYISILEHCDESYQYKNYNIKINVTVLTSDKLSLLQCKTVIQKKNRI